MGASASLFCLPTRGIHPQRVLQRSISNSFFPLRLLHPVYQRRGWLYWRIALFSATPHPARILFSPLPGVFIFCQVLSPSFATTDVAPVPKTFACTAGGPPNRPSDRESFFGSSAVVVGCLLTRLCSFPFEVGGLVLWQCFCRCLFRSATLHGRPTFYTFPRLLCLLTLGFRAYAGFSFSQHPPPPLEAFLSVASHLFFEVMSGLRPARFFPVRFFPTPMHGRQAELRGLFRWDYAIQGSRPRCSSL